MRTIRDFIKMIVKGMWHYLKSGFFLLMFFIVMTLAELPLIFAEGDEGLPKLLTDFQAFQAMVVTTVLVGLFFVLRYRKQLGKNNPNQFNESVVTRKRKIIFTLLMLVAYFASDYIVGWFAPLEDSPENQLLIEESFKAIPLTISWMTCIFAPITEEFIFRGFFFNYVLNRKNRWCNILVVMVSGLIFGLLHETALTPALLLYASSGWILGATYMYTKDLRCSMFIHFVGNTLATLAMILTL